jgi:hypothetical protein
VRHDVAQPEARVPGPRIADAEPGRRQVGHQHGHAAEDGRAGQRPEPAHRAPQLARERADPGAGRDAGQRAKAFQPVLACRAAAGNRAAGAPGQLLRDPCRDAAGRAAAQRHV